MHNILFEGVVMNSISKPEVVPCATKSRYNKQVQSKLFGETP